MHRKQWIFDLLIWEKCNTGLGYKIEVIEGMKFSLSYKTKISNLSWWLLHLDAGIISFLRLSWVKVYGRITQGNTDNKKMLRKFEKDVDRRDIRWYYRQALERRVDKSKTKFKKMKKVVDKEEWIWYSNMAVARERPVSSRTSSFTYGWFDNALCALRKDKTADKQINLQPDFVFLTYFVRCQIYTEHW